MTIKQIIQTIEEGQSLKNIAEAYSEIASVRLKTIRADVERNRRFYEDIAKVYKIVREIAAKKQVQLKKNNKTLSILVTSNYRFYGNINNQLVKFFIVKTVKYSTDRLIIGHTGVDALKAINYFNPYQPKFFKTDSPNPEELKNLVTNIKDYNQVLVYYSQFKSVLVQVPTVKDVTEYIPLKNEASQKSQLPVNPDFILEPELNNILDFFSSQITTLLLEQVFLEAGLARTASRLISMDEAQTNANEFIKIQKRDLSKAKRSIANNRILETAASLANWQKEHYAN